MRNCSTASDHLRSVANARPIHGLPLQFLVRVGSKFLVRRVFFCPCFPTAEKSLVKTPTHQTARILEQCDYPAISAGFVNVCQFGRFRMRQFISQFHGEESGQDMLEYALVLAAVLTAVVAGSTTLSSTITTALGTINTKIQTLVS